MTDATPGGAAAAAGGPPALETPVAFIVFNRPEPTRRVFAAIRAARPTTLLVIADGARAGRDGEAERVAAVRAIVAEVDWPCRVLTDFAAVNMGCGARVSSGLDWVFAQVDRAIVLEDDCLPSPSFFRFCETMLGAYRDDRRIFAISGSNFGGATTGTGHYYSDYALMWGWATWADRWAEYRFTATDAAAVITTKWWKNPIKCLYWQRIFRQLNRGLIDTWDYQWLLTLWRNGAVAVRPPVNLVQNIGFGADATHTSVADTPLAAMLAVTTDADFAAADGPVQGNRARDRHDDREWALLNWRSVALMYFPWLSRRKWQRR